MAKHLCPAGSFALGPSKLFTCATFWYQLSLVVCAFSYPALHHHFLDVIFQPLEVHLNVQISPSRTRGSLHLLCSYRVTRHSLQSKPLFLSSGRWFLSETLRIVRYCVTITEVIDCTSLWRSPGMISSCTELSEAKNDMSVD